MLSCVRSSRVVGRLGVGAVTASLLVGATFSGGCNNAAEGGLSGAALGAGAGAIIGSLYGGVGKGAAIGAVAGGLGGALVGDQNERNRYQQNSYYQERPVYQGRAYYPNSYDSYYYERVYVGHGGCRPHW